MKIVAYFSYNPSYIVEVPFTITFEKCFSTVISPGTSPSKVIYEVGGAQVNVDLSGWTHTYPSECNSFTFT